MNGSNNNGFNKYVLYCLTGKKVYVIPFAGNAVIKKFPGISFLLAFPRGSSHYFLKGNQFTGSGRVY